MYRIKIIKKYPGFILGTEKMVTLSEAKHLKSKGIAKILSTKNNSILSDIVAGLEKRINAQDKDIKALKELISNK